MSTPAYVAPVDASQIASLGSDQITKKNYDQIIAMIDNRFDYVLNKAMEILGRKVHWYAYGNVKDGEDEAGEFDPDLYAEEIEFAGDINSGKFDLYEFYIPTKWLSEDFEDALKSELTTAKKQKAQRDLRSRQVAQDRKSRRKDVIASIKKKLTAEELSFISFNDI